MSRRRGSFAAADQAADRSYPNTLTRRSAVRQLTALGFAASMLLGMRVPATANQILIPLKLYWSPERGDNFVTATEQGERDALAAGYRFVRIEGYIWTDEGAVLKPFHLYWSGDRGDNFTTATEEGERSALDVGYVFARTEGYVWRDPFPFLKPLRLYYSTERGDNFTTATEAGEREALAAGYLFARIEGYVLPADAIASTPHREWA